MKITDINSIYKTSELLERAAKEIDKVYAKPDTIKRNYDKKYKQSWKRSIN